MGFSRGRCVLRLRNGVQARKFIQISQGKNAGTASYIYVSFSTLVYVYMKTEILGK